MLKLIRKLPMLLILVTGVCALYFAVNYHHQQLRIDETYAMMLLDREHTVDAYVNLGKNLGSQDLWDQLSAALEDARVEKRIDFYILQHNGHALWFGEKSGDVTRLDIQYPPGDGMLRSDQVSLRSTKIAGNYQLTVGFDHDLASWRISQKEKFRAELFDESIYMLVVIFIVGLYTLRDIRLMAREVKRGKRGKLSSIKATNAESTLFMKGFTGYAQAVADLESENLKLGRQVLPSLQKEIHSGRKPPYDFECTMVRTDINGFSTIFNTHNVTEFMATINEFFDEVSRIVARYGGLIHEFVGDEVIFYFKDDEHANSFAIALSAVRDLNEVAANYNKMTMESRGYPFTVKSSAAHGRVRFGPLVGGFTIAGAVLIETVRILGYVVEKDDNVIYFDGINSSRLKPVIESHERMHVKMKGYQTEVALYQYDSHMPLSQILGSLTEANVDQLRYYRSDRDLQAIIASLSSANHAIVITLNGIRTLREPYIAKAQTKLGPDLRAWIAKVEDPKILSALVKLYINLVPKDDFTSEDRSVLEGLMAHADRRVVANTVEVLTHFAGSETRLKLGAVRDDLRIAANSIIYEGSDELTPVTLKKLNALLKSKKANEIASGLYALGELAQTHRLRDFAYYSAHVDFQALIERVDLFAQHTTTMVRRQALTAARKAANESVIAKIRFHVKDSGSELLAEELKRYLDTTPVQKSSAA